MTITVGFVGVADSIGSLSISGVTMRDIDQIPDTGAMICPVMFPQPDDFITGVTVERKSFGSGGTAKMDMTYTMNYVFLLAETGSGISAMDAYSDLITKIALIVKTILTNDDIANAVDMEFEGISSIGAVIDPSGNSYWGALMSFSVLEFVQ